MHRTSFTRATIWAAAFGATLVAAAMPCAAATDAPDQVRRIAGLDVAVWLPTGGQAPHPVVLFSHGVGGCKTQSSYLMRALARDGILVAAPDHADKDDLCPTRLPGLGNLPDGLLDPANWGPSFHEGRRKEIQALRAALPADPALSPLIDPGRVALVGHSLGGYTVLGLAGAWPAWRMGGIAAAVALAPFVQPFSRGGTPAGIGVPVLYQLGDRDELITPAFEAGGFYAATPAPACKVVYQGAGHLAWTDLQADVHIATAAATAAFLNEAFAGRRPTTAILNPTPTASTSCK